MTKKIINWNVDLFSFSDSILFFVRIPHPIHLLLAPTENKQADNY